MSPRWNPDPDVRTGRHVVYNLHAHLVFVTKYRRKAFTDAMLTRCEEVMRQVCQDFEAELKQFNGEQDQVHLLVHYPPKVQLSKLVNSLKGISSRLLLRRKLRRGTADRPTPSTSRTNSAPYGQPGSTAQIHVRN